MKNKNDFGRHHIGVTHNLSVFLPRISSKTDTRR